MEKEATATRPTPWAALLIAAPLMVVAATGRIQLSSHSPGSAGRLALALAVALLVLVAAVILAGRSRATGMVRATALAWALAVVLVLAVVVVAGFLAIYAKHSSLGWHHAKYVAHPHGTDSAPVSGGGRTDRRGGHGATASSQAPLYAGAGLVLAIVLVAGVVVARRSRHDDVAEEPTASAAFGQAVDESLADLRSAADVRAAVIACYARMERALGRVGQPRASADAPADYVAKVGSVIAAARAPMERLSELFEVARFSEHAITEEMRSNAIEALESLRRHLVAAA